ncbi:ribulose 1,5-bisphosphate carboxylase, large subunit [Candidatus Scalindua japonica]|uniref:Ribulose 1,5-bisphosphate carboxylase, large subunit n=1 Tax=Candidatus Scalindua japonica TaxID=1284222 RepID=A0A286U3F4_9BACT|nr:DUF3365 domain-containing protein [Candidatus Scalindua japonica]GAX62621.1 ribulose 1,5-bisphosphate carboxylase, large subunit [Candidatus Scalindua japonica]
MLRRFLKICFICTIVFNFLYLDLPAKEIKHDFYVKIEEIGREKAIKRGRQTVKMLDEMYKTFIVLVTDEYVKDETMFSALTISKKVFERMSAKGWYNARLLDATGDPHNPDNSARTKFERDAIEAFIDGKSFYEKVEKVDGVYYYKAATSVSIVTDGCTICHPHNKQGDLLGGISYSFPLDMFLD